MRKSGLKILCMVFLMLLLTAAGERRAYAETVKETAAESETAAVSETNAGGETQEETEAASDDNTPEKTVPDDYEIPEGVRVNGIDLGGLSVKAAQEKLEQYVDEACSGTLTLTVSGEEVSIPYEDFNLRAAESTIVQEICEIGTRGNLIKRYKELADVKNNKADYQLLFEYDHNRLNALIEEKTSAYNCEPQDAVLVRHSGEFQITDEVTGIKVDVAATAAAVEKVLGEGWDGTSQKLAVIAEETKALHTRDELETITDLLGSYSTNYSSSSSNRIANIVNGTLLIDETVLYPGETFSFLAHTRPFTSANGYYTASGYAGGKVVPSMGGGICQLSSTMYNAVLRAELEVVERYNHGLTVGYVPLGADATIADSSVDFKFKNNLEDPIYIEAYAWQGNVYVSIYGHETRPSNRTIEFYSVTEKTIAPGNDVITEDNTRPEGWQEVTQSAHTGYVASFYKYVYVDGELQDKILINTSSYSAAPRYVTVGTKKEEPEEVPSDTVQPEGGEQGSGSGQEANGQ